MDHRLRNDQKPAHGFVARLDHAAQGVNAVLLILAIGLAALDFTCFCALQAQVGAPSADAASAYSHSTYSHSAPRAVVSAHTGTTAWHGGY
ncbi:MAG TPA: hypothetical protein VME41_08500 [Stellaceae bacterium]|nr:hypothetical protein [Stellaceae bacterium]